MARAAKRTDPELWEELKAEVTATDKGGRKGQWSARKAQFALASPRPDHLPVNAAP